MGSKAADFESELAIDQDALDGELSKQAHNVWEVGNQLALAISRRDECKLELERLEADLHQRFRDEADRKGTKTTEKAIAAEVESSPKIGKLKDELLRLSLEVGQWQAMRDGFTSRDKALGKLADLYLGNYWAKSSAGKAKETNHLANRKRDRD